MAKGTYFPKVKEAREVLKERAEEILQQYLDVIKEARAANQFDVATKSLQWLIEHMPDEEGESMVNVSVDKPKQQQQVGGGPTIQIGFALGGVATKPALPEAEIIDVDQKDITDKVV